MPDTYLGPNGDREAGRWEETPENRERLRTRAVPVLFVAPRSRRRRSSPRADARERDRVRARDRAHDHETTIEPARIEKKKTRRKPTRRPRREPVPKDWSRQTGRAVTCFVDFQRMLKTANADPYLTDADRVVLAEIVAHAAPRKDPADPKGRRYLQGSAWEAFPGQTGMASVLGKRPTNVARSMRMAVRAGYLTRYWKRHRGGFQTRLYWLHVPVLGPERRVRRRVER